MLDYIVSKSSLVPLTPPSPAQEMGVVVKGQSGPIAQEALGVWVLPAGRSPSACCLRIAPGQPPPSSFIFC